MEASMIAKRSPAWWRQFSAVGVLVALSSCSSGSSLPETIDEHEPGALSGELAVYIADFDDGTTETRYMLRDAAGVERRLSFDGEPDIVPGTRIHVWGDEKADVINVAKFKVALRQ